jgi:DtxR family Mn-dependent transcriptional regulator
MPSKRPPTPPSDPLDFVEENDFSTGNEIGLTTTIRKYLVQIYRLSERGTGEAAPYVGTSALAEVLDVSPPAVNRMVTRLRDLGLLEYRPHQGIRLTEEGRREALKQLRLHRIVESFLVTVMGFKWHEVHHDADHMSLHLTDALAERMWQMAGQPATCPHGEPIPSPQGTLPPLDDILMTEAPHHIELEITRVRTRERDRLEYLAALGLVPGARCEILHAAPFNGPLQLRLGKEYRIVGHNLAEMLRVRPVGERPAGA